MLFPRPWANITGAYGFRLGDTIHLLQLLTTGAFDSVIALAPDCVHYVDMPPASDDSGPLTS